MKKTLALLLALLTCFTLLAGCAQDDTPVTPDKPADDKNPPAGDGGTTQPDTPKEPFTYYYVRSTEDTTLSNHDCANAVNINLVDYMAGLLYRYMPDESGTKVIIAPGIAAGEPTTTDGGITWQIKLDENAKWENGEDITADTLIYSWKMQLDPKLMYSTGSAFASNFITIKNATAYWRQVGDKKEVAWEDVGIKKVDNKTVEITCTGKFTALDVMRQFQMRYTAPVYQPIYEKCISADGMECTYGTEQNLVMAAGMFKVESWTKGVECIFVKNEYWPHADEISIDKVISRVVTDESTRIEMFEKGECDSMTLGNNGIAKYGEDPRVMTYYNTTIQTIEFNYVNSNKPWLGDPIFRKAMFYAADRNALAKLNNGDPSPFFLSRTGEVSADGTQYRNMPEAIALVEKYAPNGGYDPELAKKYFDETLQKYNITGMKLNLIYTEGNEGLRRTAEYLQANLPKIFGEGKFEITLTAMNSASRGEILNASTDAYLEKGEKSDTWDMAFAAWGLTAERYKPWKKFEKYTSWIHSFTAYNSDRIDTLYKLSETDEYRLNEQKMKGLLIDLETAFYEDMIDCPLYSTLGMVMNSERIQLPIKEYVNGTYWTYATLK